MPANYEIRIRDVKGLSLSNLATYDLYRGEIVRVATGAIAYETRTYSDARTARLQAARLVKNYEHHLAKHGVGFEEQEAARKAKERADRKAKQAAERRVRDEAHAMLAVIRQLHAGDTTPAAIDGLLADCREILDRIDGK